MKQRKILSALTAASCVLSFAASTGSPAVLSVPVSAESAVTAAAVTTAATVDTTAVTSAGYNPQTTATTYQLTTDPIFSYTTTDVTVDLRNVPLQGKFTVKIIVEDILGLQLPALDCELFRMDTDEVVAAWNTGENPNMVVEDLEYSFKRMDANCEGDIIYALRIKNMPDGMVFYETKGSKALPLCGKSLLEFAYGFNTYGKAVLCDKNYTEPVQSGMTTANPQDAGTTYNNTTETTTTVANETNLHFSLGMHEGQEIKGDTVHLTVSKFSDRSIPVFGVKKNVTVQYSVADPKIAEIAEHETQSVTLRALKAGNTVLTAKSSDGQTAAIKVSVDTLDPDVTDCSDAFMTFGILGDGIVINEGNTFGVPVAGFYEDLVEQNGLQFTVEDESVAEVVKGDRQYFILSALKTGKTKVTLAAGKGNEHSCYVEVLPAIGSTAATTDIILPQRNTNVTSTCVSENTQPVWDEEGHYRGTNAPQKAYLETVTEPEITVKTDAAGIVQYPVDLSGIKIKLVEERRFNINEYDVTGMLKVLDTCIEQGTGSEQTFCVTLGTDYKDGKIEGIEIKPVTIRIKVSGSAPATAVSTDIILPARNTNVTTTCLSDSTLPVWDEQGHYRGTNAPWNAYLETATEPKITVTMNADGTVQQPVDLSGIKINLIEERSFNTWAHDVTGMLKVLDSGIEQGTGPEQIFFVTLGTDYKNGKIESIEIKPVTIEIKLPDLSTGTDAPQGEAEITVSTTTGKTQTGNAKLGDVNGREGVDISDAVLLARFVAEDTEAVVSTQGKKNADVNGDGNITAEDVIGILRIIAKLPVKTAAN